MRGMSPEAARKFCEQDEDPAEVFAAFDAAERQGRLGRTGPPQEPPSMHELAELIRRLLRELRLRDRIARLLRGLSDALEGRRVH